MNAGGAAGRPAEGRGPFARLWVRLLLAFTAVLLVAVIGPALYTRQASRAEFRQLRSGEQQIRQRQLAGILSVLYISRGSWQGVQEQAANFTQFVPLFSDRIIVTDTSGLVVVDTGGEALGRRFEGSAAWQATPIDTAALRATVESARRGGLGGPGGPLGAGNPPGPGGPTSLPGPPAFPRRPGAYFRGRARATPSTAPSTPNAPARLPWTATAVSWRASSESSPSVPAWGCWQHWR